MSATGSSLGVFRIERDIIAHQPDLVAIEFCVNDSGFTDEQAVRSGFISVTPIQLDLTNHDGLEYLEQQWKM
jgi:broad specificity polyphosphatase/5'/3'-nucleotidase SurE